MNEQEVLFKRLKEIKDGWIKYSLRGLESNDDLILSEYKDEYRYLQNVLADEESKIAYEKILDEVIRGVIHTILVIFDGGDQVTDQFDIGIINKDTKKLINENTALHEEFFGYLLDKE